MLQTAVVRDYPRKVGDLFLLMFKVIASFLPDWWWSLKRNTQLIVNPIIRLRLMRIWESWGGERSAGLGSVKLPWHNECRNIILWKLIVIIQVIQPFSSKNVPLVNYQVQCVTKSNENLNYLFENFYIYLNITIHSWICLRVVSARLHENVKPINQNISLHLSWPIRRRHGDHCPNQKPG